MIWFMIQKRFCLDFYQNPWVFYCFLCKNLIVPSARLIKALLPIDSKLRFAHRRDFTWLQAEPYEKDPKTSKWSQQKLKTYFSKAKKPGLFFCKAKND